MAKLEDFNVYFGQPRYQDRKSLSFAFGNIEHVRKALKAWDEEKNPLVDEDNDEEQKEAEPDFSEDTPLTTALSKAVEFALSQLHLVSVVDGSQQIFPQAFITSQILNKVCIEENIIEDENTHAIWGIPDDQLHLIEKSRDDLNHLEYGLDALPKAALLSIVATFDTLLYDLIGSLLKINPDRHGQERTISLKEVISSKSVEEIVERIIEEELYKFSRDSHEEQTKFIEKNFGFKIIDEWKRWPDFIEIFERRNLIAHGQKVFTQRYVDICQKHGHNSSEDLIGSDVQLTSRYLRQSLDILLEYAVLVPFSYWRKQGAEFDKKAFFGLNEAIFKLIVHNRYKCASRICEYALGLKNANVEDAVRRRLVVNYSSALMHLKEDQKALAALDREDWSACTDDFSICVAALRKDLDQVEKIMPRLKAAKDFAVSNYRIWPVFNFIRAEEKFKEIIKQVYGANVNVSTDALDKPTILDESASKNSAEQKTQD